jgi:hypothetical protein
MWLAAVFVFSGDPHEARKAVCSTIFSLTALLSILGEDSTP